ncbi:hypothetical protein CVT26_014268 [Gymnopilus dilepis]|uniref:Secreted protein n=1 Tax=Gymnopilus dilepis TaxID=231916 RepID=A0A409VXM7_9AGAR|nr:hypothetical protein CVT26_014268 [Gymnopilus dilepis]
MLFSSRYLAVISLFLLTSTVAAAPVSNPSDPDWRRTDSVARADPDWRRTEADWRRADADWRRTENAARGDPDWRRSENSARSNPDW